MYKYAVLTGQKIPSIWEIGASDSEYSMYSTAFVMKFLYGFIFSWKLGQLTCTGRKSNMDTNFKLHVIWSLFGWFMLGNIYARFSSSTRHIHRPLCGLVILDLVADINIPGKYVSLNKQTSSDIGRYRCGDGESDISLSGWTAL